MPGTATRSPGRTSPGRNSSLTTMSPASQCLPTTRASTGGASERAGGQGAGVVGVVEGGADVVAHPAVDADVGAHRATVELDLLDRADRVDRAHGRADDRPAGLDREARLGRCRARGTRARRSCSSRWPAAPGRTGRPGSCRRCRSRRRGRARAASTPTSAPTCACSASTRRAATSKPEVSKIWLPMWECRPSSSRPGAATHPAYGLEGVAGADREAELLVLVGGGDVLVGVGLDAGRHAHHHRLGPVEPEARRSPGRAARSRRRSRR